MSNRFASKGGIAVILVLVTLGLVSLGTKLPSFAGVSKQGTPKPRPRAVIQNHIKSCKQTIERNHRLIDVPTDLPPSNHVCQPQSHHVHLRVADSSVKPGTCGTGTASRAPPLPV